VKHAVSKTREPFRTASGKLEVHQVLAWQDNLIWLLVDVNTKNAAVVDGPEAGGVLDYCNQHGIQLTTILNTHTHGDHVGINHDLAGRGMLSSLRVVGSKSRASEIPGITEQVADGDSVEFAGVKGQILLTEGHLDGHISFVFEDVLFCGDTMFGAGCGYLFDGPPEKMQASLERLAALSPETRVCCAHEYTQDNLRFAWSIDSNNPALAERIKMTWALRERGECSVPSTIGLERDTNPFLRWDSETLRKNVMGQMPEASMNSPAEIFAATRALKDRKDYREIEDQQLPLA